MSGQIVVSHGDSEMSGAGGSGDYSATKEFLWHQQRVKQEELELQEQLEQLKASKRPNTTASANPKLTTGQQQQQQQQKRPSLQPGEMSSQNKSTNSSKMMPQQVGGSNPPPSMIQRTQVKKSQVRD